MGQGKKRIAGKNPKMPSVPLLHNRTIPDDNGQVTFVVAPESNAYWFAHQKHKVVWRMPYTTSNTQPGVHLALQTLEQMVAHLTIQHKMCLHHFRRCAASHCIVPVKHEDHTCNLLDFVNEMLAKDFTSSTTLAGQKRHTENK
jgi:hypothetical protein